MKHRLCKPLGILLAFALCLSPRLARAVPYAPLDCAKASSAADTTICKTYALGQDEARLATLLEVVTSLVAMGQRGDIMDKQQQWLAVREACRSDMACLSHAYQSRIDELSQAFKGVAKQGPF